MTPTTRRLLVLLAVVMVGSAFLFWPSGGTGPAIRGGAPHTAGRPARGLTADALPELELVADAGDRPAEVVRDVFRFHVPPTPVPTPAPPPPTPVPHPGDRLFVGPLLPTPVPPPTPIVPPALPYRVTGIFGPRDNPIVALEDSGRLISARSGDVLDKRFVLRRVNRESVDFSFVGLPDEVTRRLPVPK